MNTKTLDNTANDPWADIATADLVNYVRCVLASWRPLCERCFSAV